MTEARQIDLGRAGAASAMSGHLDTRTAAMEVADLLHDDLGGHGPDLLLVFASFHHRAALPEAVASMRRTLGPRRTLAVTSEAVIGGGEEREGVAAIGAMALRLPGVELMPFACPPGQRPPVDDPVKVAAWIGWRETLRGAILFADPFTLSIGRLLPALATCGPGGTPVPVVGGMASGASRMGGNVLILDDLVLVGGAVGVTLAGPVRLDVVVSQGGRPIGVPHVATRVQGNLLLELGGRPALEVLREETEALPGAERDLVDGGLLLGHVIDERKRPLGRGDFLVRSLLGAETDRNALIVGDVPRPGQTVQLHVRDAVTAAEDLELLLDAQMVHDDPFAALLFSCNGRGRRLFGRSGHDLEAVHRRFPHLPVAGLFAAGEIGPIGGRSFLHGHSAVLALLRERATEGRG